MKMNKEKKPILVSFISHSASLNGSERSMLELLDGLVRRGMLCHVLLPSHGILEKELEKRMIPYDIVSFRWWNIWDGENSQDVLIEIKNQVLDIVQKIDKINPDIIYTNTSVINIGAMVAKILKKPHVWHIREFGEKDHGLHFKLEEKERYNYISNNSDVVIFNSCAVEENFLKYSKPKYYKVVYNNVNLINDNNTEKVRYYDSNHVKLLILGSIFSGKGQLDAVMAVNELLKFGNKVELIIAGWVSSEEYLNEINKYIREHKLEKYIKILSFIENPYSIIKESDIVLSCSRNEAFGRTILEAMLLSKAVIGSKSGGLLEIIKDNYNGLLYDSGNAKELAERIKFLCDNPDIMKSLGENGNKFVKENFSDQKYSGGVYDLLVKAREMYECQNNFEVCNFLYENMQKSNNELKDIREKLKGVEQEVANLNKIIQQKEMQLNATLNSTSWKITRPLRIIANKFKRSIVLIKYAFAVLKNEGVSSLIKRTISFFYRKIKNKIFKKNISISDLRIRSFKEFIDFKKTGDNIIDFCVSVTEKLNKEKEIINYPLNASCDICGSAGSFNISKIVVPNANFVLFTELLSCPRCLLNNRQRASLTIVLNKIKNKKNLKIFCYEQITPFFKVLSSINKKNIVIGSEFFGYNHESGEIINGIRNENGMDLSFPDKYFDFVVSNDVFEHIPDFKKAFKEAYRVLKDGGQLIFTIPFHFYNEKTIIRAIINKDGSINNILPPVFHGNPVDAEKGSLCFHDFSWDLFDIIKFLGFSDVYAIPTWNFDYAHINYDPIMTYIAVK